MPGTRHPAAQRQCPHAPAANRPALRRFERVRWVSPLRGGPRFPAGFGSGERLARWKGDRRGRSVEPVLEALFCQPRGGDRCGTSTARTARFGTVRHDDGPADGRLRCEGRDTSRRLPHQAARYPGRTFAIEPDASAASYFFAAAAITGGDVTVEGLSRDSLQGDVQFVKVLEQMGCTVQWDADSIRLRAGSLRGVDVDMNAISDTAQTLAAVAVFAQGPTRIRKTGCPPQRDRPNSCRGHRTQSPWDRRPRAGRRPHDSSPGGQLAADSPGRRRDVR